jgi:hypothetical protein
VEILFAQRESVPLRELAGYRPDWGRLGPELAAAATNLMAGAPQGGSARESVTARG